VLLLGFYLFHYFAFLKHFDMVSKNSRAQILFSSSLDYFHHSNALVSPPPPPFLLLMNLSPALLFPVADVDRPVTADMLQSSP
jgi:hypothetical protein